MSHIKIAWRDKSAACSCVPIIFVLFDDADWQGGLLKLMKNDHFFSIFSRLGPFPQVFGQVKRRFMLKLHKIIRVSHVVASSIVFILFCERSWQNFEKWSFYSVLSVWVLFPKFLADKGATYVRIAQNNKSVTCSCVPNCFLFYFMSEVGREECL